MAPAQSGLASRRMGPEPTDVRSEPRRVLILGASSPIGVALCRRYLACGDHVTAHFHTSNAPLLGLDSASLDTVQWDLSELGSVRALADLYRDCDVLVHLAAETVPTRLESVTPAQISSSLAVGAVSAFLMLSSLGPSMAQRGWGRIVFGSSIGVKFGGGLDSFAYAFANHALEFIPQQASLWARCNVLMNVVRIGVTRTGAMTRFPGRVLEEREALIPMRRSSTPEESARFLHWLGSDCNTYVSGQVISHSGGE